jgi:hypothetical protein
MELSYYSSYSMKCETGIFSALLQLRQLQSLDCERMVLSKKTQALTSLQGLTSLRMADCCLTMRDLAPLSVLMNLRKLSLETNMMSFDAEDLHFINLSRALTQLTSVSLADCDHLHNPLGMSELKFVQELDLSLLSNIELADLPAIPSLTKLTFNSNWAVLDSTKTAKALCGLQHLDMCDCFFGEEASAIGSLVALTRLEAVHGGEKGDGIRCVLLTTLGPLQQLRHLAVSSDFKQSDPISSFSVLGTLQHLTHLELRGPQLPAGALAAMFSTSQGNAGAACLPRLQRLQVHKEDGEEDWQALGGSISSNDVALLVQSCPELRSLTLTGYPIRAAGLTHMSGLTGLTALICNKVTMSGEHKDSHSNLSAAVYGTIV